MTVSSNPRQAVRFCLALAVCAVLASAATPASAQSIAGRFVAQNQQGGTIVLILIQDAQRQLTGSLTAGNASFKVEGMVDEDGMGIGAMSGPQATVFFQAELNESQLILTLIEPGSDNMPDYSRTREIAFTRQGDATGTPAPAAGPSRAGGNPLAKQTADPFVGSFTGNQIALELSRGGTGYTGTLTVQGQAYPVTATAQGGRLAGAFTVAGQQYRFEAQIQNNQLMLVSEGTTYQLARAGGGASTPANPLAQGGARAGGGGGGTGLLGNWSCQTGSGAAQLGFVSESQLTFNGEATAYQLVGNVVRVQGDYGPVDYRYQLSGDQLMVTGPDGSSMQCRRQAAAQPGAAGAGGTGMEARLRGRICSFSSSPDGGMSTLYILEFDGQGRFTWGNESSYSGDPGSAYGKNTGNVGTYRVGGLQVGSPIIFTYGNGQSATGYVAHVYQGEITEVRVNDRHYGKTICQ